MARAFSGADSLAAVFLYSRNRGAKHPEEYVPSHTTLMQAGAHARFKRLFCDGRWRVNPFA